MFRDDERAANQDEPDAACQPLSADALLEDLGKFRREFAALEGQQQEGCQKHNDALYQLAARIGGRAALLRESTAAWARFVASPDWAGQKPPKRHQQARAIKHAVRFVLPEKVSRQVRLYWTIALEELHAEGINSDQIAATLSERRGFQAIYTAKRERTTKPAVNRSGPVRLFRKPAANIPAVLRNARIVNEDGHVCIVDGSERRLLILAVPPGLLGGIEPGELELKAIVGEDDLSVLELTAVVVKHSAKDLHLRKSSAVPERNPQQSLGSDIGQPLEP